MRPAVSGHGRLAASQRRLWRLIAWPEGVAAALGGEPPDTPPLDSLIRSDARLGAEARLDVYANAYFFRIHDVLAEDYPSLRAVLGETDFHDLVTSYLAVHPSTHPSLRWIGGRLSGFLREHPAAAGVRARCPLAADLADLEWATEMVFDAADSRPATRDDLARLAPEAFDALPLRLRPSVRLLHLAWPVHELRAAWRREEPLPEVAPAETAVCVWRGGQAAEGERAGETRGQRAGETGGQRAGEPGGEADGESAQRDGRVMNRVLAPDEAAALDRVATGVAFGALCEAIAAEAGDEQAPALAAGFLARWVDDGLLLGLEGEG